MYPVRRRLIIPQSKFYVTSSSFTLFTNLDNGGLRELRYYFLMTCRKLNSPAHS